MKILFPNLADFYDPTDPPNTLPGFPKGNLLDPHILKPWKATQNQPGSNWLGCLAQGAHDSLALFGLQADQVTVRVYASQAALEADTENTAPVETHTRGLKSENPFGEVYLSQVWFDLSYSAQARYFKILLTKTTGTATELKAGVITIGLARLLPNPTWSSGMSLQNHSLVRELKNGSTYRLAKPISKKLQLTLELPTKGNGRQQFYQMLEFYRLASCQAFAMVWAEGLADSQGNSLDDQHLIWGAMDNDFKPTEGKYSLSTIEFSLTEEL